MERSGSGIFRRLGVLAFLLLVLVFLSFILMRLGAAPPAVLLGGPEALPDDVALLNDDYGLNQPAPIQFVRYVLRLAGGEMGRSWLTGTSVASDLLDRIPATLELMLYGLLLGALAGVPLGYVAAVSRQRAEDKALRMAALVVEAVPAFVIALVLLLVFFRFLDIAPAPTGRISVVLSPPPTITGSYFIDAFLIQDSVGARSALAQLALPVLTLATTVAAALLLTVRNSMLAQFATDHYAHARRQGMSPDMLARVAFRGAAPAIGLALRNQVVALLGVTSMVEFVFSWGGIGHYGLDAMVKADMAAVQGFILFAGLFGMAVHGVWLLAGYAQRFRVARA
jgi:peptide/nickel transport system permease protein